MSKPRRECSPGAPVRVRRMGIDTYQSPVIYLRRESPVCRSEGFEVQSRIEVRHRGRTVIATLNVLTGPGIAEDEAGLSEAAWRLLGVHDGDSVELRHPEPVESLAAMRAKVYGHALSDAALSEIVRDISAGRYSELELAAFVTACAGNRLSVGETTALTRAMVDAGDRLAWPLPRVVDKHCIGGVPGNRTSLIVVPIVAAAGLAIPKTSSRAITSPAGTADTMETLAPVDLDLRAMRQVVEREGGCIVWGGAARLAPADDVLIQAERPLDFDSDGQLVASVLSKKVAAGSTHVLVDIPWGPTAKVRSAAAAHALAQRLAEVGAAVGLQVRTVVSDGGQPVGRGIGPALEARDVLAVLENRDDAPADLRERSLALAATILEFEGETTPADCRQRAETLLRSGAALRKLHAIAEAQGGLRTPPRARYRHVVEAPAAASIETLDNRRIARLAKLAGAPRAPAAGVELHVRAGEQVRAGQPLLTVHAESTGELAYALRYYGSQPALARAAP